MSRRVNASLREEEIAALEAHPEYAGSLGGLLRVLALRQLGLEPADAYADHRNRPRDEKGRIMKRSKKDPRFSYTIEKDESGKDVKLYLQGEWVGWLRVEYGSTWAAYRPASYNADKGDQCEWQTRMGQGQSATSPDYYLEAVAVKMALEHCEFSTGPEGVRWVQRQAASA